MTDAYLVQRLGKDFAWLPRVYERTSGYIHLSSTHLLSALDTSDESSEDERRLTIKISSEDKKLPEVIYIEAAGAFRATTDVFFSFVSGWVFTKANPELVRKRKNECHERKDRS